MSLTDDGIAEAQRIIGLGNDLEDRGDLDAALARYREAASLAPRYARAHLNIGNALQRLGRLDDAIVAQRTALAIDASFAPARCNLGNLQIARGDRVSGERELREALRLAPDLAAAAIALANLFEDRGHLGDAEQVFRRTLQAGCRHPGAINNLGLILQAQGRHHEASACYREAIALDPGYASAHFNEGLCRLLTGDFEAGWREHEWRWSVEPFRNEIRDFARPLWLGESSVAGRSVLLHADQGLGDTVQFCRYVPLLAARGATVVLEVQPPLESLLAPLAGASRVLARGEPLPPFDCHCPLLSLPLAFDTRLASVPAQIPYLRADPLRVDKWRARLGACRSPRVGLAWSGRIAHGNDRNRSIALAKMSRLLTPGAQFVSLQKDLRAGDKPVLDERTDILHFGDELDDYADTAALIELMDVVIAVDTSVAHVAGAMGKTTWILLPFNPDWRWLLDREDSPWYPTARLFRQPAHGDWDAVLEGVARALRQLGGR